MLAIKLRALRLKLLSNARLISSLLGEAFYSVTLVPFTLNLFGARLHSRTTAMRTS